MGLFWDYFKAGLRFLPLFRPGPLAMLTEGAAATLDSAREIIPGLRDQFLPALCEEDYLLRYAASRGIVRSPLEPEEYFIARVKSAYLFWFMGGRASSMEAALRSAFGFESVQVISLGTTELLYDETIGEQLFAEISGEPLEAVDDSRWAEFDVIIYP